MSNPLIVGYKPGTNPTTAGSPYGSSQPAPDVGSALPLGELLPVAPDNLLAGVKKSVALVIDFTDMKAAANILFGPLFPIHSQVVRSYYQVLTTFTSATDAATIGFGFATDDAAGIVATVSIVAATDWDAIAAPGFVEGIQTGVITAASNRLTAARQLQIIRGGGEVLTAGKLCLYLDYIESVAP